MNEIISYLDSQAYCYHAECGIIIIPFVGQKSAEYHAESISSEYPDIDISVSESEDKHGYDIFIKTARATRDK